MTVRTLCELFSRSVFDRPRPDHVCLADPGGSGTPPLSSVEIAGQVERLYMLWRSLGARKGDQVLLWMPNRPEWALADFSLLAAGLVDIPLYPSLPPAEVRIILEKSHPRFAVVGDEGARQRLLEAAGGDLRPEAIVTLGTAPGIGGLLSWKQALEAGERRLQHSAPGEFRQALAAARPEDTATLIYTSGTTGSPKGVMLSHANIVSNVLACLQVLELGPRDVTLSFLPLCHIYERMLDYCYWYMGARIVYVADPRRAGDALRSVGPSFFGAVPRFYEKLILRIEEERARLDAPRRRLFDWARTVGLEWVGRRNARQPIPPALALRRALAGWLVYRRVRRALGGRLRQMISGGAPLARQTADALWALDLRVLQGYGLTETSPVVALNPSGRNKNGTVGPPIPGTEVRIGADGEILVRGPGVTNGYYGDPGATRAAFMDGWFATGDVGRLDEEGFLIITDRKKELIVSSGGKKIAPAPLERRLESDPLIAQAMVIGDRRQFLSALLVPEFAALEREARALGMRFADRRDLVGLPEVHSLYEKRLAEVGKDLAPYEQIRRFTLLAKEWSAESGEITPTLKVKRRVVEERYRDLIERMYTPTAPEAPSLRRS